MPAEIPHPSENFKRTWLIVAGGLIVAGVATIAGGHILGVTEVGILVGGGIATTGGEMIVGPLNANKAAEIVHTVFSA